MAFRAERQTHMALVDDDPLSARQTIRMLIAHGAPSVALYAGAVAAETELAALANHRHAAPSMVLVDLKAGLAATERLVRAIRAMPIGRSLLIGAFGGDDEATRERLERAGADATFIRHDDVVLLRRESAAIVSFWVRHQRLDAVGT